MQSQLNIEKELSNDDILSQISKHNEAIKVLKTKLKPTVARVAPTLLECNQAAKAQRAAKFSEAARVKKAVTMALARAEDSKVKPKAK